MNTGLLRADFLASKSLTAMFSYNKHMAYKSRAQFSSMEYVNSFQARNVNIYDTYFLFGSFSLLAYFCDETNCHQYQDSNH